MPPSDPVTGKAYGYSSENLLTSSTGGGGPNVTLAYDPLLRLGVTARAEAGWLPWDYQHDGLETVAAWQLDPVFGPAMVFRYVPGPSGPAPAEAGDEPVAEYYLSNPVNRRQWFHADERDSIVAVSSDAGEAQATNRYDEFGRTPEPAIRNYGLYGYTGQLSLDYISGLPELTYYKARIYAPHLGRFLQTDPIGYAAGPNLYAYVLNDPVNLTDPLGLICDEHTTVCGKRLYAELFSLGGPIARIGVTFGRFGPNIGNPREGDRDSNCPRGQKCDEEQQCKTPPISSREAEAARAGDLTAFWASRFRRGDPLGATGLTMQTQSSIAAQWSNMRLRDAISSRSPGMSGTAVSQEVRQIGVQLMRQHVSAVTSFGSPSAFQIANYHFDVLAAHGLPSTTFGGAPISGTQGEAWLTSGVWMNCQ